MAFPLPQYSRTQVQRAGEYLVQLWDNSAITWDIQRYLESISILTNWRACHGYPINTFQATLRTKLKKVDPDALVAQRLKRTPSIIAKLKRNRGMSLSRMQDIGGLRAVVAGIPQLANLRHEYANTRLTHYLVNETDYVAQPKESGYRSVHLIYRYKARIPSPYDGLQLELQFRTKLQHAWATAVETAGTFLQHSLKSSEGPDEWLKFFSLASSAFAYQERQPLVPGYEHLSRAETFTLTVSEADRLGVENLLRQYSTAINAITTTQQKTGAYYLVVLHLSSEDSKVEITPFARDKVDEANKAYSEAERIAANASQNPTQVVLVSAGSIDSLKRAYPNYFLDTHEFLKQLERIKRSKLISHSNGIDPTEEASGRKNTMQRYKNLSGESGVVAYDIYAGQIIVQFRNGDRYLYTEESAGAANVHKMQELARTGRGLSTFISEHVHSRFERKVNSKKLF